MEKKILEENFKDYLAYVFNYINLNKVSPVQNILAEEFGKNNENLFIKTDRGFGKTIITAIFASWKLLKDEKILIIGGNTQKAKEFELFIKQLLILVPILKDLQYSIKTVGVFEDFNFSEETLILVDDIEILENFETIKSKNKLNLKIQEILENKCSKIFIGTEQFPDSIYKNLPFKKIVL